MNFAPHSSRLRPCWTPVFAAVAALAICVTIGDTSSAAAQEPPEFECWSCAWKICEPPTGDDEPYKYCARSEFGTNDCDTPMRGNGCPVETQSCRESDGYCVPTMAMFGPAQDEAVRIFESGGLLPSDGFFYVAIRDDEYVLRRKCGRDAVAWLAIRDVGRSKATVVLAGG